MKISNIFFALMAVLWLAACSSSDDNSVPATWTVLSSVQSGMDNFDNLMADSETLGTASLGVRVAPEFDTDWTTSLWIPDPRFDGNGVQPPNLPPQDYMGLMLDSDETRTNGSSFNLFGRFESAISVGCALMNNITLGSDGYPANTTSPQTLTFTAAMAANLVYVCGMEDGLEMSGETVTYEVANAGGSIYDKLITLVLSWEEGADNQMEVYLKYTSSSIKILAKEIYDTDSGTDLNGFSRSIIDVDTTTGSIRAEYFATGSSNQIEFHRGYYNGAADEAYILSYAGAASDAVVNNNNNGVRFVLVGKPESTSGTVALSFSFDYGAENYTVYDACVNPNTGDIVSDGVLTCTLTGTTVAQGTSTIFTTVFTAANSVDTSSAAATEADLLIMYNDADETVGVTFDETNFNTVAPADF